MNTTNLKQDYRERIVPILMKEFGYSSVMQAPKLEKIVLNQGLGIAVADKKIGKTITEALGVNCKNNEQIDELMRVIRFNLAGLLECNLFILYQSKTKKTTK